MIFPIEHGIPVPEHPAARKRGRAKQAVRLSLDALALADVGASVCVSYPEEHITQSTLISRVSMAAHNALGKGCYSLTPEGAGIRVWKIGVPSGDE